MVGIGRSIAYGINDLRYITGESVNKKHPEKISHVSDYFVSNEPDAMGVWQKMKFNMNRFGKLKNNVITLLLSPSAEHTRGYTKEDWKQLWDEFIQEFDQQELYDKEGKLYSEKTNLANSIGTVWLHLESKGEVPHLHAAICRRDNFGNINNDHKIDIRDQTAAEIVAQKRGWITAQEIHESRLPDVTQDCYDTLKEMSRWSWDDYVSILNGKGYTIKEMRDKNNNLKGYSLNNGRNKYRASELGKGRNLKVDRLEDTWKSFHKARVQQKPQTKSETFKPMAKPVERPTFDYSSWKPGTTKVEIEHDSKIYNCFIPDDAIAEFENEIDYSTIANHIDLTNLASALFVGLLQANAVPTSGGGGGTNNDLPWRDKDEDDRSWARRCARFAISKLGVQRKTGRSR